MGLVILCKGMSYIVYSANDSNGQPDSVRPDQHNERVAGDQGLIISDGALKLYGPSVPSDEKGGNRPLEGSKIPRAGKLQLRTGRGFTYG